MTTLTGDFAQHSVATLPMRPLPRTLEDLRDVSYSTATATACSPDELRVEFQSSIQLGSETIFMAHLPTLARTLSVD